VSEVEAAILFTRLAGGIILRVAERVIDDVGINKL